jgi:hypothetical protein
LIHLVAGLETNNWFTQVCYCGWRNTVDSLPQFRREAGVSLAEICSGHQTLKIVAVILSSLIILIGCLYWMTPFPGGTAVIALGVAMLIYSSDTAARRLLEWRRDYARLNWAMSWIEDISPVRLADTLRRTRPTEL